MHHRNVIAEVARRLPHQTRQDVYEVIEVLTEVWFEELANGGDVVLRNIGQLRIEVQNIISGDDLLNTIDYAGCTGASIPKEQLQ